MATAAEILEVRNNTNTTTDDYTDQVIEDLIDAGTVDCASANIWKWELAKLGKTAAKVAKKTATGAESHEFNAIKDQLQYYKEMLAYWEDQCRRSQGNTSGLLKATPPPVAGVLTEDQLNGDVDV